eukprot:4320452-Amphidinium_carterae.1
MQAFGNVLVWAGTVPVSLIGDGRARHPHAKLYYLENDPDKEAAREREMRRVAELEQDNLQGLPLPTPHDASFDFCHPYKDLLPFGESKPQRGSAESMARVSQPIQDFFPVTLRPKVLEIPVGEPKPCRGQQEWCR